MAASCAGSEFASAAYLAGVPPALGSYAASAASLVAESAVQISVFVIGLTYDVISPTDIHEFMTGVLDVLSPHPVDNSNRPAIVVNSDGLEQRDAW